MKKVSMMDTSILCNVLPVPGRDQDRDEVLRQFRQRLRSGEEFILPVTSVIETGNFIAQISDGGLRRLTAQKLHDFLELVLREKAPWRLHSFMWDETFIRELLAGGGTQISMVDHAIGGVGCGDLCILVEREIYRNRTGLSQVEIWTLDTQLHSHN